MSEPEKSPGGVTQPASSGPDASDTVEGHENDVVKYATYQKVLAEKKRRDLELSEARQKLSELEAKEKKDQEDKLKADGEIKKLLDIREKEILELKNKHEAAERTIQDSLKLDSVLRALDGRVDEQYYPLINLDSVVMDPNSGRPDLTSVQNYAKEFTTKYHLVIEKPGGARMPNSAAQKTGSLTYEEWLKLPKKDMKARIKEVMGSKKT